MSEPQTNYETDTGVQPTPGPVSKGATSSHKRRVAKVLKGTDMVGGHNVHCDIHTERHQIQGQEPVANADLIVAAFNAAQKAKEMGYDPQKAVEALPELLESTEQLLQAISAEAGTCAKVSPPVREKICSSARDALASAEGDGDE